MTLAWDPSISTNVVGYNVYYGPASQYYTNQVSFGNMTNGTVDGLVPGATYYFAATAVNAAGGQSAFSNEVLYQVPTSSTPPTISAIGPQTVNQGSATGLIPFTVGDAQVSASNLTMSAQTSYPWLVPVTSIVFGGSGSNRTVQVTPTAGVSGSAVVTLTVSDGQTNASSSFQLTVVPPPSITLFPPLAGSSYTAPGTLGLSASVVSNSHVITGVQFYNGTSLLGQDAAPPYVMTWSQVPAGSYSLTARVTYDSGSWVGSSPVAVTVTSMPPAIVLTSPSSGANYTAPGGIALTATVTPNGHTINGVQFYNGSTLLGQVTTPPYGMVWTNVGAGLYSLTAQATFDSTGAVTTQPASITVTNLPAPWQTLDVGSAAVPGTATIFGTSSWFVSGAGSLGGTSDSFRFVYQPMTNDGYVLVQLTTAQNAGTNGLCGVMMRTSLTNGSPYAFMGALPDGTFTWQARGTAGGSSSAVTSGTGVVPNVGFCLQRFGNSIYGYKWDGGSGWILVSSTSISMGANPYFGMVVSSGSTNALSSAQFDYLKVSP